MKILVITSSFPRFEHDIAGAFVLEHARMLSNAGHAVTVVTWQSTEPASWQPEFDVIRVPYAPRDYQQIFYGDGAPENVAARPWVTGLIPPALAAMVATALPLARQADLVVGHWLVPGGMIARWVGKAQGIPSLVIGHSAGVHTIARLPRPIRTRLATSVARGPITLPTRALSIKLERAAGRPLDIEILPMGVASTTDRSDGADWLVMARLVPIKNIELAIRAFVQSGIPDTLHIAGDGLELRRLRAIAGSHRRIEFHGWVTGEAKRALLNRCGHILLTSRVQPNGRHEGLPVTLLEAQAAGLLPLVSDTPGADEAVFDPRCVISNFSTTTWAAAIRGRAELPQSALESLRDGARAFGSSMSWDALWPRWDALIRQASDDAGRPAARNARPKR